MKNKFVLLNPEKGQKIKLAGDFLRVGRAEDCDIVLKDPSVSRNHVHIYLKENTIIVEDAGSRSGFFINGKAQKKAAAMKLGDTLQIGNQSFQLGKQGETKRSPTLKSEIPNAPLGEENDEQASRRKRIRLYLGVAGVLVVFAMFSPDEKKEAPMVQDVELSADSIEKTLQSADLKNTAVRHKSLTEIEAEGKFKEGLRDYHNGNFIRAIKHFNDALTQNPNMEKAQDYLQYAHARLEAQINHLMQDGQRSFALLQYQRAKAQFVLVLSMLSEQIPGYWQREAVKVMNRDPASRQPIQEEVVTNIPCEQTKMESKCKLAVELIKQARINLGEENSVR